MSISNGLRKLFGSSANVHTIWNANLKKEKCMQSKDNQIPQQNWYNIADRQKTKYLSTLDFETFVLFWLLDQYTNTHRPTCILCVS